MVAAMGLVKVASAAFNVLKSSIGAAVSRFDTMQKFPKVMKALGFSAKDSEKSISKLSDGIDGLPTTLDEVVANTQQLTSITGDLDKSTDTVLALNNAFLASGASTEDASRGMQQYNQMVSSGQVDLESWKTLQETMPLALQKTAEAMGYAGKSAQRDLYSALKDGKVTFDDFQNNLIKLGTGTGMLAKLAKENSLGISTSFGNLRNAISKGVANIITKLDELTKKFTGKTIAQNIDGLKIIINNTFNSISKMLSSGGFTKAVQKIGQGIKTGLEIAVPIFKKLGVALADFLKAFVNALPTLTPVIQIVVGAFLGLGDVIASTVLPAITKIFKFISQHQTLFKAVAVGVLVAVSAFKTIKTVISIVKAVKNAVIGLNTVLMANPIILIISLVVGLIAALVWFFTQTKTGQKIVKVAWEGIKDATIAVVNFLIKAWQSVTEFLSGIWDWIKDTAGALWDGVVSVWQSGIETLKLIWQGISTFFSDLWNTITSIATTAWTAFTSTIMGVLQPFIDIFVAMWNGISEGLSLVWEGIKNIAQGAWEIIKNVILAPILVLVDLLTGDFEGVKNDLAQIWGNIKNAANQIWIGIKQVIAGWVIAVVSYIRGLWDGFKQYITTLWNVIKSTASNAWGWIKSTVINLVIGLVTRVISFWNSLKSSTTNIWNGVKSLASSIWNNIKSTVINLVNGIKQGAINAWNNLKSATSNAFKSVVNFIKNPLQGIDLFKIGKNIIQGLINGIGNMAKAVQKKVEDIAGGIKKKIKGALGIHSPSRVMRDEVGRFIPQGIAVGIEADSDAVDKAMKKLISVPKFKAETAIGISKNGSTSLNAGSFNQNIQVDQSKTIQALNSLGKKLDVIAKKDTDVYVPEETIGRAANRYMGKKMRSVPGLTNF
ncbi:phage tail protein [Listeria fleischmannii]|uniref:Tape measure protein n=1 Tax=Listeria fleischmannii TaxID=1069827 RepID=A0A841YE01_9LIST|nr:tape measure protein [Listeria fleischmannii]MBC1398612.1 tape measure protein [Listeria fleischmannii]MBC1427044.1 tape measure protein [Listeria fleischmannii]STY36050.1 Phage-related protein [Listeria fleischmannii subsp. coloradonensis]